MRGIRHLYARFQDAAASAFPPLFLTLLVISAALFVRHHLGWLFQP